MGGDPGEYLRLLGEAVRRSCLGCGLSGPALARRADVSQPTISRIENGRAVSDGGVVARVVAALDLDETARVELSALAKRAYRDVVRRRVDAGVSMRPGGGAELARNASVLRCFQSAAVPSLLQTADYAAAVLATLPGGSDYQIPPVDERVWGEGLLRDGGQRLVFVITEGALRTWPDWPGSMLPQLDGIAEADELPGVRVGVVPWSAAVPVVPLHGFTVYDDVAVTVQTFARELTLTDPEDVTVHGEIFDAFERSAVFGAEMRRLLAQIGADYRELEKSHVRP